MFFIYFGYHLFSDLYFLNVFPVCCLSFLCLPGSFTEEKLLIFMKSSLSVFLLCTVLLICFLSHCRTSALETAMKRTTVLFMQHSTVSVCMWYSVPVLGNLMRKSYNSASAPRDIYCLMGVHLAVSRGCAKISDLRGKAHSRSCPVPGTQGRRRL